ncbi:28 kDa heat- and acid-stable phosphoprotein [Spatholobus suberectus]|nr:28 kDa heat- and acid-stable phosphoprotein [Spatholobus suberectus]
MGRGKFKSKPTGRRQFSTPEDLIAGTSTRPRTFRQKEAEHEEEVSEEASGDESEEKSEDETTKTKGTQGVIEIENPNLIKPKNLKARDVDVGETTELSRREREEIEKQRAHERYMRLQEQGKTEQARKDLERLALIRQQRAEAAKKLEEEKFAKEQKKAEARKSWHPEIRHGRSFMREFGAAEAGNGNVLARVANRKMIWGSSELLNLWIAKACLGWFRVFGFWFSNAIFETKHV